MLKFATCTPQNLPQLSRVQFPFCQGGSACNLRGSPLAGWGGGLFAQQSHPRLDPTLAGRRAQWGLETDRLILFLLIRSGGRGGGRQQDQGRGKRRRRCPEVRKWGSQSWWPPTPTPQTRGWGSGIHAPPTPCVSGARRDGAEGVGRSSDPARSFARSLARSARRWGRRMRESRRLPI